MSKKIKKDYLIIQESDLISQINNKYPELYVTEKYDNYFNMPPENEENHIEYKSSLSYCKLEKDKQKYASQMSRRLMSNITKRFATYYIGLKDDGTIYGLDTYAVIEGVFIFVDIIKILNNHFPKTTGGRNRVTISGIEIIHIEDNQFKSEESSIKNMHLISENTSILKINVLLREIDDIKTFDFDADSF